MADEHRAKTATFMLAANVLWMGTGGATLGMDFEGGVMLGYSGTIPQLSLEPKTGMRTSCPQPG